RRSRALGRCPSGERVAERPRQPCGRILSELALVLDESAEVLERVLSVHLRSEDEAHVDVADVRAAEALVEERRLAKSDRHLEKTLADVVVDRRSRNAKEEREGIPSREQIPIRLTESGVGLDALRFEL